MHCDQVFDVLTRGPFPTGSDLDDAVEAHLAYCASCRRLAIALQPSFEHSAEAIGPDEGRDLPTYWGELFTGSETRASSAPARLSNLTLRTGRRRPPRLPATRFPWNNMVRFLTAVLFGVALGGAIGHLRPQPAQLATGLMPTSTANSRAQRTSASHWSAGDRTVAFGSGATQAGALALRAPEDDDARSTAHAADLPVDRSLGLASSRSETPIRRTVASLNLGEKCRVAVEILPTPALLPFAASTSSFDQGRAHVQQCCTQCHKGGKSNLQLTRTALNKVVQSCEICHNH